MTKQALPTKWYTVIVVLKVNVINMSPLGLTYFEPKTGLFLNDREYAHIGKYFGILVFLKDPVCFHSQQMLIVQIWKV